MIKFSDFKLSSIAHTLALFGSFSTLFCCALPALFVTLGAGAVLAGIVSNVPQLIWLSEHKIGLFIFAGIMLFISGLSRYLTRKVPKKVPGYFFVKVFLNSEQPIIDGMFFRPS
jgi:hypothetical protein